MGKLKLKLKVYIDKYGNQYLEGAKNQLFPLYKLSNNVYELNLITELPVGAITVSFEKADGSITNAYPMALVGNELVGEEYWNVYNTLIDDDVLNISEKAGRNMLGISFHYGDGSATLNSEPIYVKCSYSINGQLPQLSGSDYEGIVSEVITTILETNKDKVRHTTFLPLIVDDESNDNYNVGFIYVLDGKCTEISEVPSTPTPNVAYKWKGENLNENEPYFVTDRYYKFDNEKGWEELKTFERETGNIYLINENKEFELINYGKNAQSSSLEYLHGVFDENQILDFYDTLSDGRYAITSEEYGDEIIIINKKNNYYKRFTGGYDYTFDFELGDWVIASGGGGGTGGGTGGGGGAVTLIARSPLEQTIAVGSEAPLSFYFRPTQGNTGTAQIYINNTLKKTTQITRGENTIDVGEFIQANVNNIQFKVNDTIGSTGTLIFSITGVELKLTSNFNSKKSYTDYVDFRYTPYGANIDKKVVIKIDDNPYDTQIVKTSGEEQPIQIKGLTHGVHKLEVNMSGTVGKDDLHSNTLKYNILFYYYNTKPLISSDFTDRTIKQGENLIIEYFAYSTITMSLFVQFKLNGETVSTRWVERDKLDTWNIPNYIVGENNIEIYISDECKLNYTVIVEKNDIPVEPVTTNLDLYLSAKGKSNSDSLESRLDWHYKDVFATLNNFNWSTNGWILDDNGINILRINGKANVEIPFKIFETDAKSYGKTIEIDFATRDVYDINKVLISCFSNNIGLQITSNKATLESNKTQIFSNYKENERIRLSFVIQKQDSNKFIKTFINGVLSGIRVYTDDIFEQLNAVNIKINEFEGSIDIYSIRVYNQDLSDNQMLNNYLADLPLNELAREYTQNKILDDYGNVSYDLIKPLIPHLLITGNLPKSKGDKKNVNVEYYNPFNSSFNFNYQNVTIDVQGTSSQYYPRKNYKIKFAEKFSFYENAIPEKEYTFKADYMESSHSHNTGNAVFINSISPKFPTQEENPNVRNSIYGFPIVIFARNNESSDYVYYGVYNFNNDKGNTDTLGLTTEKAESWEFKDSTSLYCTFRTDDFSNENTVLEHFEARYPKDYKDFTALSRVVSWVYSTTDNVNKFKEEFNQYFNLDFCLFYYVMMDVMLAVDSRAKNMFLDTLDGQIWYPRWYDIDTTYGLDNEGHLRYSYGYEQSDLIDGISVYNGADSVLWNNFGEAFKDEIKETYQQLRNNGVISYESILAVLNDHQIEKISKAMYNTDGMFKYERAYLEQKHPYLYVEQGDRLNHLQWWLYNRLNYLDSKYNASDYQSDYINMRLYTPETYVDSVPPSADFYITPFTDMYLSVTYGANPNAGQLEKTNKVRTTANTKTKVDAPENFEGQNTETIIYGATRILDIGDLSNKYARSMDFSKAVKLKQLIIGNGTEGYNNPNLDELVLGNNTMLEKLDIRNCSSLKQAIDLTGCINIKEVYAEGTKITSVDLASGGNLEVLHLPAVSDLKLKNQPLLNDFTIESYDNITTLLLENVPNINIKKIFTSSLNIQYLRITNVNWTFENSEQGLINNLLTKRGYDGSGNQTSKAVLTGKIHIKGQVGDKFLQSWQEYFGSYLTITVDEIVPAYTVRFLNYDNSVLQASYILENQYATYSGPTPTKPDDSEGYEYTFTDFLPDPTTTAITKDTNFIAQFSSSKPSIFVLDLSESTNLQPSLSISNFTSFDVLIDWGDGTSLQTNVAGGINFTKETAYDTSGVYEIKVTLTNAIPKTGIYKSYIKLSSDYSPYIISAYYQEGVYKAIGYESFKANTRITSIVVPEGVEEIQRYAFSGCTNLKSVVLPSTLQQIIDFAFQGCQNAEINIPKNITSIGFNSFHNCINIKGVIEFNENISLGYQAFDNCTSIKQIIINSSSPVLSEKCFSQVKAPICFSVLDSALSTWHEKWFYSTSSNGQDEIVYRPIIYNYKENISLDGLIGAIDKSNNLCLLSYNTSNEKVEILPEYTYNGEKLYTKSLNVSLINDTDMPNIKELVLPNSIEFISNNLITTQNLTKLTVPFIGPDIENSKICGWLFGRTSAYSQGKYYPNLKSIIITKATTIAKDCFDSSTNVKYLELPDTLISIGSGSTLYIGTTTDKAVIKIHAITPPEFGGSFYYNWYSAIYVPMESVELYKTATTWSGVAILYVGFEEE